MMTSTGQQHPRSGDSSNSSSASSSASSSLLDLRNDHFFQDSNPIGSLSNLGSVSEAIEASRRAVVDTPVSSQARKELINKLIKLRIRYYDLKEREEDQADSGRAKNVLEVRGHQFVRYSRQAAQEIPWTDPNRKLYCESCSGVIWLGLQSSRHCLHCSHSMHESCLFSRNNSSSSNNNSSSSRDAVVHRPCVAEKANSQPDFILTICPEKSLPRLKFRCVECDCKLDPNSSPPRLCDYTGLTFCVRCHWNSLSVTPIPARAVHNWDLNPRPVSQAARQYLALMRKKPVINLSVANPKLFAAVQELDQVRTLREKVMHIKRYLVVCRLASESRVLLCLSSRQHFVDSVDFYSLQDLEDVSNGKLVDYLQEKIDIMAGHVKSCVLCRAKGFICELCNKGNFDNIRTETSPDQVATTCCSYVDVEPEGQEGATGAATGELLFPFDEDSSECPECRGVFHRQCFKQAVAAAGCPRCIRKKKKKELV